MLGEEFLELRDGVFHLRAVLVVDHDGERKLAEGLTLHSQRSERASQFRDGGGFGVIDQVVLVAGVLPVLKV